MIYGLRLKQARELRGLTQIALAERVGVVQGRIAQLEAELSQPSDELLSAIVSETGFPRPFFEREPSDDFALGSLLFRARKSMTAREQKQAHRFGEIIFEFATEMAHQLTATPVRLPRLAIEGTTPRAAAEVTRAALGLSPDGPIPNLVSILERGGVLVLALPIEIETEDAFSLWAGPELERPVIAVLAGAPGDRLRMSVAHELGHLVMHKSIRGDAEREAVSFGAEFLLPEDAMRHEVVPPVTLTDLSSLKPRWGVSIQALIMRARELEIISPRQYRYLFEQLARRHWRTREPEGVAIPIERPRAVRKMAELLYGEPPDVRKAADAASWSPLFTRGVLNLYSEKPVKRSTVPPNVVQLRPRVDTP